MQLSCPTCASQIKADNINIQDKIAVCANCDTVFEFADIHSDKPKRRKSKQPTALTIDETHNSTVFSFRTNWRLDSNETFITGAFGAGIAIFLTNFLVLGAFTGEIPIYIPMAFALLAIAMVYSVLLTVYNQSQIEVEANQIRVRRAPLPGIFRQEKHISLHGVTSIEVAETEVSKERGYDTPRYIIWAETVDGTRRPIVTDLVEDYAYFITQRLNELIVPNSDAASRLADDISENEDMMLDDNQYYQSKRIES